MKNLTSSLIALSFIALVFVTAGCVHRDQAKETAPVADQQLVYPAECQGQMARREDITIGSQLVAVRCVCVVGQQAFSWFSAVANRDPAAYCQIFPGQAVVSEPMQYEGTNGYLLETSTTTTQTFGENPATQPPQQPPLPSIVPFATPSTTIAAPPPVPPTAKTVPSSHWQPPAAKEPKKFTPYVREQSVQYQCKEGVTAERTYVLVYSEGASKSEQAIKQTCSGQTVGCLQGKDRTNYMIPPCSCAIGEEIQQISSQGLWTCHKK